MINASLLNNRVINFFIHASRRSANVLFLLLHFIRDNMFEQVMAYMTVAAVAASAQSAAFAKLGQPELQWMKLCNMYGKYCNQVGEGVASAVIVSLSMVALSSISAFSLFRLYGGGNKGKSSTRL